MWVGDLGDVGLTPESERPPGEGNGKLLQYSCLKNPMDRGAWRGQSKRLQRVEHSTCVRARACMHTHTHTKVQHIRPGPRGALDCIWVTHG